LLPTGYPLYSSEVVLTSDRRAFAAIVLVLVLDLVSKPVFPIAPLHHQVRRPRDELQLDRVDINPNVAERFVVRRRSLLQIREFGRSGGRKRIHRYGEFAGEAERPEMA